MAEKTAFITDLGKVMVDYDWTIFFQLLGHYTGQEITSFERRFFDTKQQELVKQFCTGQINKEQFYKECCSALEISPSRLPFVQFVLYFNRVFTREISAITKLLPSIKKCFDLLIIITNTNQLHFDFLTRKLPHVFTPFDLVIASHKIGFLKPENSIYNWPSPSWRRTA